MNALTSKTSMFYISAAGDMEMISLIIEKYTRILHLCRIATYNTDKLLAIHCATCLRAKHSLQKIMSRKLLRYDTLLNGSISRNNLLLEIEHLISYVHVVFNRTKQTRTRSKYLLCTGLFWDTPVTLITTEMTHRDILNQNTRRTTMPHEDITSFHRLDTSLRFLKNLPEHEHIVSILAYQLTPFPVFFVFKGSYQMSLGDELYKETEQPQTYIYASRHVLISFVKQAIIAIIHCHKNNMILRDINSSKFLISGGELILCDLSDGIQLSNESEQSKEGEILFHSKLKNTSGAWKRISLKRLHHRMVL